MSQTQINYWNLNETKRSNRANEKETARHNKAQEGIAWYSAQTGRLQLAELKRSNRAQEKIKNIQVDQGQQTINENIRHNQALELVQQQGLEETHRHNIASEFENSRHNMATEAEDKRHNQKQEKYWWWQNFNNAAGNVIKAVDVAGGIVNDAVGNAVKVKTYKKQWE